MTPEEIINVLREVDADAKASEGDYYADQFAWHGAGEIADAVEQMAAEIARLREERRSITTLLGKVETLEADNERLREERRWVPVGERLPELNSSVLVACGYPEDEEQTVSQAWHYRPGLFTNLEDMEFPGVTHWQPLPPGPEANG